MERKVAQQLLVTLDTPRSLTVEILMRYHEWDQLVSLTTNPDHYLEKDFDKFKRDLQATDLLRKNRDLPTSWDRAEVARESFYASERKCRHTNDRLRILRELPVPTLTGEEQALRRFLRNVKKLVGRILGAAPDCWQGRFGPGVTFEAKDASVRHFTVGDKIENRMNWSGNWNQIVKGLPPTLWRSAFSAEWCSGNRFTAVPKNAKTFRGICIEPGLNIFSQLGIGAEIRRALKRKGIDLEHGQHLHAKLAEVGSKTDYWCTIDLESASDTVAYELVLACLPKSWFSILNGLRSRKTEIDGRRVVVEKFSSMGNGFTFELETLIFAAIASVASGQEIGKDIFVYGDDIIVPNQYGEDVLNALRLCGFLPNARKTFLRGLFRESCGGQFFNGLQVETCKLEEFPKSVPDWFSFHNALYRFDAGLTHAVRNRIRQAVPIGFRKLTGPQDWGDGVLHGLPPQQVKYRNGSPYAPYLREQVRRIPLHHFRGPVVLLLALYGAPSNGLMTREVSGFMKKWRVTYGHAKWPWIPTLA